MYQDNWVPIENGIKNHPVLIDGTVVDAWVSDGYEYCQMSTGKTFKRSINFHPASPYGWEETKNE